MNYKKMYRLAIVYTGCAIGGSIMATVVLLAALTLLSGLDLI